MILSSPRSTPEILRTLPDGLILRRTTPADAQKLSDFNSVIHSDTDAIDPRVGAWTSDLLSGRHPTFAADDFTLIEDPRTGKIVSSLSLISQTWTYAGIPVKVGRPELVGTDPEYRRHGLVRAQFDVIHEWSRQRGELLQAITGIPYYYRQFGYEMAVNLGGGRAGAAFNLPRLEKDQPEPFRIRPAAESDAAFLTQLYREGCQRSLLAAEWNEPLWRHELSGKRQDNVERLDIRIIETLAGERLGYLTHPWYAWNEMMGLTGYELKAGVSWYEVTPTVIRYIWQTGEEYARREKKSLAAFGFWLIENHPAFQVAGERLPINRKRYAWYLRVPDLPAFLKNIAPALEERLANSPMPGYSGELKLGFYRSGINIKFQSGKLAGIDTWQPATKNFGKAAFPDLTFLQLLFGYRTIEELTSAFPDCFVADELKPVLRVLFPKQPSEIWPIH
jgi:hypothetical protein